MTSLRAETWDCEDLAQPLGHPEVLSLRIGSITYCAPSVGTSVGDRSRRPTSTFPAGHNHLPEGLG